MPGESVLQACRDLVESRLDCLLPPAGEPPKSLHSAMRYSVLGGGKRLRPSLSMASSLAVGGELEAGIDVGCAAEFVHCFSLIHDDLPAIDDDNLRRGKLTVHRRFTEAIAVLAGDALFALAFATLGRAGSPEQVAKCLATLSFATGGHGLVGGEVMDVEAEGSVAVVGLLETIHRRKTGALISSACEMGGIAGGGSDREIHSLSRFGMEIGFAFQVVDDVLNETSTAERLGKASGSDRDRSKLTYPSAIGIDRSRETAEAALEEALRHLTDLSGDTVPLREIALACVERDN